MPNVVLVGICSTVERVKLMLTVVLSVFGEGKRGLEVGVACKGF